MTLVTSTKTKIRIRKAIAADIPRLREVIEDSVRGLQAGDYSPAQIEGALQSVYGVDSQLIADGTYLAAEVLDSQGKPEIVGCGGWSKRKTLYGGDQYAGREDSLLDPAQHAAKIRCVLRTSEVGAPRDRQLDSRSLREHCAGSGLHAPGDGRNSERSGFLSGERICGRRKSGGSTGERRSAANCEDGKENRAPAPTKFLMR